MKWMFGIRARCLALIIVFAPGCAPSKPGVTVFAAASVADAVEVLADRFEAETGHSVSVSAAASSVLAQQIAAGADAALFLSANAEWADYLEARGQGESRVDLLRNRLVLVVPVNDSAIASPEDLLKDSVHRIAVADTESVPAGQYAKHALKTLGVWDSIEGILMPGADVRQALVYVERGEADAGLVYGTDAAASGKVRTVYEFGDELTGVIVYPLMLTRAGAETNGAREFFDFLQTADALAEFGARGFRAIDR